MLDEVMGKITLAIHAILEARNRVPVLGNREEGYQESAKEEADRYQAYGTAREKVYELIFEVQRLRLRFGLEHAITKGYLKAQQGLEDLLSEVTVDKDQWTVAQREVLEKKVEDCGKQNKDLAEACRKYTDVEIAR